jgi:gamma-glutamyltranspeptidase / glutathione hydrolase
MKKTLLLLAVVPALLAASARPAQNNSSVRAEKWMVASGHELASEAGREMLRAGGNAYDAAVAMVMALNVTRFFSAGAVGVAPTLVYDARAGKVRGYIGLGPAPMKASVEYFRRRGWPDAPFVGANSQLVPASPDVWIGILEEYGTKSFAEVAAPAIRLCDPGHAVNETEANVMSQPGPYRFFMHLRWPYNYSIFYAPHHGNPQPGDQLVMADLAHSLRLMADAEARELAVSHDRIKGLEAARAVFYQGEIADGIVRSEEKHHGLITREDLAGYHGGWEEPRRGTYHGYEIWANNTWCQGPTVPMTLQIIENIDLQALGYNSPEYLSAIAQAVELAFADREAYFGDPAFVDVPIQGLLAKEYAAERARLIDPHRAFGKMPAPGDPWKYEGRPRPDHVYQPQPKRGALSFPMAANNRVGETITQGWGAGDPARATFERLFLHDTTYLCVIDRDGNAVSITPSDFPSSPMVEGFGLILGSRMSQFHFEPGHPARLAPGKRPRLTPNPSMVTKDGKLFMAFGTPGGDMQPQAMVQVFLNVVLWGLDPQAAIDAPRIMSKNFPDSFSPHTYNPGRLVLETALRDRAPALTKQGYDVKFADPAGYTMGAVCAIIRLPDGSLIAGADPREQAKALGD